MRDASVVSVRVGRCSTIRILLIRRRFTHSGGACISPQQCLGAMQARGNGSSSIAEWRRLADNFFPAGCITRFVSRYGWADRGSAVEQLQVRLSAVGFRHPAFDSQRKTYPEPSHSGASKKHSPKKRTDRFCDALSRARFLAIPEKIPFQSPFRSQIVRSVPELIFSRIATNTPWFRSSARPLTPSYAPGTNTRTAGGGHKAPKRRARLVA